MNTSQYNSLAEQYEYFVKNSALRKIDEYTIFNMTGDVSCKSILDLACGYGHFSQEFYRRGASKVVGIDISDKMIEIAQKKAKIEKLPIKYRVSDVIKAGSIDKFDVVLAIWLFNYASSLDDLYSMFKTCVDNLKNNGVLIAYTMNPHYSFDKGNYTKYGFNIISEAKFDACVRMKAEFVTPNTNKSEITFFRWSMDDYEKIITDLGFSKFKWITPTISKEDMNIYSNGFWDTFTSNKLQIGLICTL